MEGHRVKNLWLARTHHKANTRVSLSLSHTVTHLVPSLHTSSRANGPCPLPFHFFRTMTPDTDQVVGPPLNSDLPTCRFLSLVARGPLFQESYYPLFPPEEVPGRTHCDLR